MSNVSMNPDELMMKIYEYGFAIVDLGLYLDTHPQDVDSLATYNTLKDNYNMLTNEYSKRFSPLCMTQVNSDNYWSWVSAPWPWEGGCK